MKKQSKRDLLLAICMLVAFLLWTVAIRFIDVQAIGPRESTVGFATINRFVHNLIGVHMSMYTITDWLGLVPIGVCVGFAIFGLIQWSDRKNLMKVDFNILVLGGFYIITMVVYLLFENIVINYRPVLINGYLEASYPSSTTMLVLCVMSTAIMQLGNRIKNNIVKTVVNGTIAVFIGFMVVGRLLSGVHWFTDIIGGALISSGLIFMYRAVAEIRH